jgi:hypothetical protein
VRRSLDYSFAEALPPSRSVLWGFGIGLGWGWGLVKLEYSLHS